MDELAKFNRDRWNELSANGLIYSRPWTDLTKEEASNRIDPQKMLGDVTDKEVLLLAGSAGQQSVAFAMLGARVTVFDLSEAQLEKDRQSAKHHGFSVQTRQGDMRDLSIFPESSFDLVWHAHSLSFVPNAAQVIDQVSHVIRPKGLYRLYCTNPFVQDLHDEWNGEGYVLKRPYIDGEMEIADPYWEFDTPEGKTVRVKGPREFKHTLSTIINSLVSAGFVILGFWEETAEHPCAEEGSWPHFKSVAPPWMIFVSRLDPVVLDNRQKKGNKVG